MGRRLAIVAAAAVSATMATRYRRWHQRWGATDTEVDGEMPGDSLLATSAFVATRAITIAAPPERVWPWLVQTGFGRAGFYSYDLLDNLGRHSADVVLPEFQNVAVGDLAAPMASPPDERTAFTVAEVDAPHSLVWGKPDSTWAWRLDPVGANGTRLVTRLKAQYVPGPLLPATVLLMEIGDFPMMRRMLLGIRARAEQPVVTTSEEGRLP